jgi:hypothetical protein
LSPIIHPEPILRYNVTWGGKVARGGKEYRGKGQ